jgi:RNA polymerase sigma factor (sigma-70 family)
MASASGPGIEDVGGPIARLFGEGTASGADEGELLRRFAFGRDPVALEVLVARHGPMVLGVCRRVLGDRHSSEDAFQATFLVLARKAGSIRDPDRLGPWLHGVAHRVAVRSRADLARRNSRERLGAEEAAMETSSAGDSEFDRLELRAALDEEVRRLPEKFRDPIVLCYLDGLTHDEAATRLRCPVGTVRSRLSTGRARLRDRLARRGVAVPSGAFAAVLSAEAASAAVSPALLVSTVKAATVFAGGMAGATAAGTVSAGVATLAEGVVKTMIISKLKIVGGAALAGMLTLGVGAVASHQFGGGGQEAKVEKPADESPDAVIAKLRIEAIKSDLEAKLYKAEIDSLKAELKAVRDRVPAYGSKGATRGKEPTDGFFETPAAAPAAQGTDVRPPGGVRKGMGAGSASGGMAVGKGAGGMGMAMGGGMGAGGMGPDAGVPAGGMMSGMGGMMMGAGAKSLATLQMQDFVIVHKPKSDKVAAYSNETGAWTSYEVPKGVEVTPIAGPGVLALMVTGDEIGQIAAFAPSEGRWFPIDLKEPAKGRAAPIVSSGQAVYSIGRRVYAFSAMTRSWDVLELPEGAKPNPTLFLNRTTVEHDDHISIFSVKSGKWADFDAGAGRVAAPGAK